VARKAKIVLVVLALSGLLISQGAALSPSHNPLLHPAHHCTLCQAGHLPIVTASSALTLFVPIASFRVPWRPQYLAEPREPALFAWSSRAPPA